MHNKKHAASWSELLWGRNGLRSLALAGGVAVHAVNVYIATTILPSVVQDIGGLEYYAWNTTLFVVASILGSALSPKIMGVLDLRRAFLLALAIFALGTAACALSPTMLWMLFSRTIQGLGGGLLLGLSYSAVRLVFEERLWSLAMALVSSMWGVATLAGPAIGGIFAQTGHWRLAFWSVLPIAALLGVLVVTQLAHAKSAPQRVDAPLRKISLLVLSVLVISVGSLSQHLMWNLLGVAGAVGIAIAVARADERATTKLMPTGGYALRAGMGSMYACIALLSVGVTTEIFVPYFLQVIHGRSPLVAGYMTAFMSVGWTLGSLASASKPLPVANRNIRAGPVVSAISLAALAAAMPLLSYPGDVMFWVLNLCLMGVGVGVGICWPHILTRVFKSAPAGQENIASAAIITVQLYAMALGASVAGIVTNAAGFTSPGGLQGARHAATALFVVFACAPALAAFLTGGVRRAKAV
jgi:MFS family permease